jgi:hypothetical protein
MMMADDRPEFMRRNTREMRDARAWLNRRKDPTGPKTSAVRAILNRTARAVIRFAEFAENGADEDARENLRWLARTNEIRRVDHVAGALRRHGVTVSRQQIEAAAIELADAKVAREIADLEHHAARNG